MPDQLEIEAKYDADEGHRIPDLTDVPGVDAVVDQGELALEATYFDTPALHLAAAGASLRRRTGGTDAGWHLKLPVAAGERLVLRRELTNATVPPVSLRSLLVAVLPTDELSEVATLRTQRAVHQLLDADGRVLAEVADDRVVGSRTDGADPLRWREVEVELVDGDRALLADVDGLLRGAGLQVAAGSSKVGRVLDMTPQAGTRWRRKSPVGDVLTEAVRTSLAATRLADPLARLGRPGALDRLGCALADLRATLEVWHAVLGDGRSSSALEELGWLQAVLAGPEALDEVRARVRSTVGTQPRRLVLGPVLGRVDRELAALRRDAVAAATDALASDRYLALLAQVDGLPDAEGGTDATARAGQVLPKLADRTIESLRHQLGHLRSDEEDERAARAVVAARTARRARQVEALAAVVTKTASVYDEVLDEIAGQLAEVELSGRTQEVLLDVVPVAQEAGESSFTYGRLHGLEELRAHRAVRELKRSRKALARLLQP